MSIPRFNDDLSYETDVSLTLASSIGVLFSYPATSNTKGAYTQLIASTSNDVNFLNIVMAGYPSNSVGDGLSMDLAIGAAGSEIILIADLMFGWANLNNIYRLQLPLSIPVGSRAAARIQCSSTNATSGFMVVVQGFTSNVEGYAGVDTLGFNSGSTKGVGITNAAANVKGSYVQLIASTTRDYSGFFFVFDCVGNLPNRSYLVDIAVGASGSEVVIIPNTYISWDAGNTASLMMSGFFPMRIPAGTRIAARCQGNGSAQPCQITGYGVF